jgi:hypothetical protein
VAKEVFLLFIGEAHKDGHRAVVALVIVGHAPVDVVVQTHAIARPFPFAGEAERRRIDGRFATAVVVGDKVILAVVGVLAVPTQATLEALDPGGQEVVVPPEVLQRFPSRAQ